METAGTRLDSAQRAINNYFHQLQGLRSFEYITLDHIVENCFKLVAVNSYLEWEHNVPTEAARELETIRRRVIRAHICKLIKEYIDGKF